MNMPMEVRMTRAKVNVRYRNMLLLKVKYNVIFVVRISFHYIVNKDTLTKCTSSIRTTLAICAARNLPRNST